MTITVARSVVAVILEAFRVGLRVCDRRRPFVLMVMVFVLIGHEHRVVEALVAQFVSRYDVLSSIVLSVLVVSFLGRVVVVVVVVVGHMW